MPNEQDTVRLEPMTNILWITENFPPSSGGVQSYLYNTIENLSRFRSTVICNRTVERPCGEIDAALERKGTRVIRVEYLPPNCGVTMLFRSLPAMVALCSRIISLVRNEKIELLIFGHITFFNLIVARLLARWLKIPVATVFHGEDIPVVPLRSNRLRRWLIGRIDIHLCNSAFTLNRLITFCGRANRPFIAHPGVAEEFFSPVDDGDMRRRFATAGRKVLVTVGRLDPRKGHDLVLDALPAIIREVPELLYLIGGSGTTRIALAAKVRELGLERHVTFCGFIPDGQLVPFYQLADIFVMPNRILEDGDTEGFGIVFLEANATGTPVIGGACGGALDAIENGGSGYFVDPYNPAELAEKIIYLLNNPAEAKRLGRYGRQRAWNRFRWPYLAHKLENFLNQSLASEAYEKPAS